MLLTPWFCMCVCVYPQDFMSRGAYIGWLSVYPDEQEALYPPLAYLRSIETKKETLGGMETLVATVQPVFP